MITRSMLVFLLSSILLLVGIRIYAQQEVPNGGLYSSPLGQTQSPYAGVPSYGVIPPMSPQGYSRLRGGAEWQSNVSPYAPVYRRPMEPQKAVPDDARSLRRSCELATSVRVPSFRRSEMGGRGRHAISAPGSRLGSSGQEGLSQRSIALSAFEEQPKVRELLEDNPELKVLLESSKASGEPTIGTNNGERSYEINNDSVNEFLSNVEPTSPIEAAYREVPIHNKRLPQSLRQYGYSLFDAPISTFAPVDDVPVGPGYILGPGDDLVVNIWGAMEAGLVLRVDRNGEVKLPSAGPLKVWGLPFSQANQIIREHLSRYYRGFKASVTMGRLRTTLVYVVGEVCQPGAFTLSSLSTMSNALFAAGGPLKLGSLRNIMLKRNGQTVGTLDLYDFLLNGNKTLDFRIESGDTIFVPPIGPTTGIAGEVKRPAIYELKDRTTVSELIEMAGGATPRSYLKRVQIIRTRRNSAREIIDLDLTGIHGNGNSPNNTILQDGDFIKIYPTDHRIYNRVKLEGAVKQPGEYELKANMRIADLLPEGTLLPEAFSDRVEIARLQDDLTTEILVVNLRKAWKGDKTENIALSRMDLISVKSDFKEPATVELKGEIVRPGIYRIKPGERLSSVLIRAGGFTDKAFLRGAIFTRKSVAEAEKTRLDEFVTFQEQLLLADTSQKGDLALRREQLRLLTSKIRLGRIVVHLDQPDILAGSPNDITLMDGDTLEVSQSPATVLVMGSVRNPTAVLHWDQGDVQYYLNRAGGLTPDADEKQIYVISADGSAIAGYMKLRDVQAGDGIIVPPNTQKRIDKLPLLSAVAGITGQLVLGLAGLLAIF